MGATLKPRRTCWCEWVRTWPLTSPAAVWSPYCSQMETSFLRFRWPSLVMPRCSQTSCSFSSIQSGVGSETLGEVFKSSGFQKRSCPGNGGGKLLRFLPIHCTRETTRTPGRSTHHRRLCSEQSCPPCSSDPMGPFALPHPAQSMLVILGYSYRHQHGYRTLPEAADPAQHSSRTCHHRRGNPASRRRASCGRDCGQEDLWGRG